MSTVHAPEVEKGTPAARQPSDPATTYDDAPRPERKSVIDALQARFRLHSEDDEPPPTARIFIFAFWATGAIFVGLIPAGRLVVMLAIESGPWWYPVASISLGLLGLGLFTAAFASIHRRYLPWYLVVIATLFLAANVAMVYTIPLS